MKVFISADMEGVAGVVHEEHVMRDGKEHERARRLMTQEVNAAIEGALEAGAKTIVVNDSHGTMRNIIPEELHEAAELVTGSPKPLSMMQGIDETFNAAFFIGYHAMASGFLTIMGHTYHGRVVYNVKVNNKIMGETGINAAVAGYYNVPVVLVTGDEAVTREAAEILGKVETVAVKKAYGRYAAQCLSPTKARKLIKEAAYKSLKNLGRFKPFKINPPITFEIDFVNTGMTEMALLIPGVKQTTSRTVIYTSNNLIEAFKTFRAITTLAATTT
ncbi:MAG: M55 family metallopeptidase [Candidatus Bathyarchaeia archaeon]